MEYKEWLEKANEKVESCVYSCVTKTSCRCGFDRYPVIDCPNCKQYKEKQNKGGEQPPTDNSNLGGK